MYLLKILRYYEVRRGRGDVVVGDVGRFSTPVVEYSLFLFFGDSLHVHDG